MCATSPRAANARPNRLFSFSITALLLAALAASPAVVSASVPSDVDVTEEEIASALGLNVSDVLSFELLAVSGSDSLADVPSAEVRGAGEGVLLSTGLASDDGVGDTDLLADGEPDLTQFRLTLQVPEGAKSLAYSSQFRTSEHQTLLGPSDHEIRMSNPDRAIVSFSTGTPPIKLAEVDKPVEYPRQLRAVDVSSVDDVTITFLVEDSVDGNRDSGLLLRDFFFTGSEIADASALAASLLTDPSVGPPLAVGVEARSGTVEIVDVLSAQPGGFQGSLLLTNGLASDEAFGDTDLAGDDNPDSTLFRVTLEVPQDGTTKSLVFTSQFLTSELDVPPDDRGTDRAVVQSRTFAAGSDEQELGRVASSATPRDPPVTRAIDVESAKSVEITFLLADGGDQGRHDSGILISGVYFSEFEADLLRNPRPADSKLRTGTYAYSKTLLAASGSMSPFGFMIHYSSSPRRTSGRMGPNWGHSYDWGVTELDEGKLLLVRRGDGRVESFDEDPPDSDEYVPSHGQIFNRIVKLNDGAYIYTTTGQTEYSFDSDGKLVSITDPNANAVLLSYPEGLLSSVEDTRSQSAAFTYDANDRLTGVAYAFQSITLEYDNRDDLVAFVDADGHRTTFTYDSDHHLLTGTDGADVVFVQNTYDELHRVTETIDGKDAVSTTEYTSSTSIAADRLGNETTTLFDPLDRQDSLEDGTGAVRRYGYDSNDNLTTTTDPLGAVTRSAFDERGNVVEEVDALEGVVTTSWDGRNQPIKAVDEIGEELKFQHDENGNLLRQIDPLGHSELHKYDGRGLRTSTTDPNGNVYHYKYTPEGDVAELLDPTGGLSRFKYDALGRETASFDANGNGTFLTFDGFGRVTSTTDALDNEHRLFYDPEGRLTKEIDALSQESLFEYTPTGRLRFFTDALGNKTSYEYNAEDLLDSATDPIGNVTSFEYDAALRFLRTTDPMGGKVSASYDAAGNRKSVTDPRENPTAFTHDAMGRVTSQTDPLGRSETNTYNARGRVASITNGRGQTIACEYDDASRLAVMHLPDHDITHELDPNGNRLATVGKDGRRSERTFDGLNRLIRSTDVNGNLIRYTYDAVGNILSITYSDGKIVRYTYDVLDRMKTVTDWEGLITSYEYDAGGKLTSMSLPDGSIVTYEYDAANRLTGIIDTSPEGTITFRTQYTLGPSGLRMAEEADLPLEAPVTTGDRAFVYDAANQLKSDNGVAFTYDEDGNMTHAVVGRLPVDLSYDQRNALVAVGATTYEYDDDGVRIGATINGEFVRYVRDISGGQVLEEHDDEGEIVARYVYGLGLIARHGEDDDDGANGGGDQAPGAPLDDDDDEVFIYHFDIRGSTVALTDLDGEITDRYAYDPYGLIVARDGDTPNPFTYNGRDGVMDDGNGLYYLQTRYYEPRLMRYVSRDAVVFGSLDDTQSLNRYAYVRGNPIHGIDPDGTWFLVDDVVMMVGGAVANVAGLFVADLISGKWSSWEDYTGAAIGGAVWGETLLYTGNPIIAGAAGAAAGNAATQGLKIASGKQDSFDFGELAGETALGAAFGAFGGSKGKAAAAGLKRGSKKAAKRLARSAGKKSGLTLAKASSRNFKASSKILLKRLFWKGALGAGEGYLKKLGDGSVVVGAQRAGQAAWEGAQNVEGIVSQRALFYWYVGSTIIGSGGSAQ